MSLESLKKLHNELTTLPKEELYKFVRENYGITKTESKKYTREELVCKCVAIEETNFFK